jgi:ADP-glucose pyrophosphorylase
MGQYDNVVAVILGGGAGSRLFPLTGERSKPAVPLGGTYRLIDVPVSNCINSEITQIFVLTQYNSKYAQPHRPRTVPKGSKALLTPSGRCCLTFAIGALIRC